MIFHCHWCNYALHKYNLLSIDQNAEKKEEKNNDCTISKRATFDCQTDGGGIIMPMLGTAIKLVFS